MAIDNFIAIGENIHCTRSVKRAGARITQLPGGGEGVTYKVGGESRILPIPSNWGEVSPPYEDGKVRHITLALHQAMNGDDKERASGEDYLRWATERQVATGARFLDINVDEYSVEPAAQIEAMKWLVDFLGYTSTPLCIDSSNVETLTAGLAGCPQGTDVMINSISLEREDVVGVALQFKAHAIVSAAGKNIMPETTEERMENFRGIVGILDKGGMPREKMFLDALVLPISVDANNGKKFLDASAAAKAEFPGVNLSGGLSNVSFGMPDRKLLNLVFTMLFVEAGGNSAIVDPLQISAKTLNSFDMESEPSKLARGVFDGTDMFGGEYIAAFRDGRLGK